jgi:hypothetical protein
VIVTTLDRHLLPTSRGGASKAGLARVAFRLKWSFPVAALDERACAAHEGAYFVECYVADGGAEVRSWLTIGNVRRPIIDGRVVDAAIRRDGDLLHLDLTSEEPLLHMTLRRQQLRYVRTRLLAPAGLLGGRYQPPTLDEVNVGVLTRRRRRNSSGFSASRAGR